jgi:hypothetical protein
MGVDGTVVAGAPGSGAPGIGAGLPGTVPAGGTIGWPNESTASESTA